MMAEFPAMPLWTDAYLGDTTHFTTTEHGAYMLLLMAMWRSGEARLPADEMLLRRITKTTAVQWRRMKPTLFAPKFLEQRDGYVTQGRLTDECNAVRTASQKQSDRSRARWLKNKEMGDAAALPRECRNDATLTLNPSLNQLSVKSLNRQPERVKQKVKRNPGKPRHGAISRDKRFVYFKVGTVEYEAYAKEFAEMNGHIPEASEDGRWFQWAGEGSTKRDC
jgi:uncharacterized protein YdaU (DUF1376 family)